MTEDAPSGHPHAENVTSVEPGTRRPRDAQELTEANVGSVSAEVVHIEASRVDTVHAARVSLRRSAAQQVEAGSLQLDHAAAAIVRTIDLAMHDSAAGLVSTTEARVEGSVILALRTSVMTGPGRNTILLNIGPSGDQATTLVSGQAAARLGLSLALTLLVGNRILRSLLGRSR